MLNPEREFELWNQRKKIVEPLPSFISEVATSGMPIGTFYQEQLRYIEDNKELIKSTCRSILDKNPIPRPVLTCIYIEHAVMTKVDRIISRTGGDDWLFITWHDFLRGMDYVTRAISLAEGEMNDESNKTIDHILERLAVETGREQDAIDEAEVTLRLKNWARKPDELYRKDPTGFEAIDYFVEEVRLIAEEGVDPQTTITGHAMGDYDPNLFFAGARLGRDIYKAVYPLTEHIPPSASI